MASSRNHLHVMAGHKKSGLELIIKHSQRCQHLIGADVTTDER